MPDALPPRELRAAYDRSAADYDARFAALQAVKYDALLTRFVPEPSARVLDLGCGTGLLVPRLEATGIQCVVALDASWGMVSRAPRAARRIQADARRLPFADGAFDAAYAVTALLLTPGEVLSALGEVRRVLAPGGVLALSLLERDVAPGFDADLAAAGFRVGPSFDCGQDRGWIAHRA